MNPTSMHEAYRRLLTELLNHGTEELNERTSTRIKMLEGGHSFKLDVSERLPIAGNRRYWPHVAAAEVAWQFMGTQDPDWILEKAPKVWQDFVEDGKLKTAYGYRWRHHFGRDQLMLAIRELSGNPTNRQLFISAWDPAADGLGGPQPKNIPCPVGFAVSRSGDTIHMSVFIRSSDVFVGLPYDVMGYALTLDAIASSVGCMPGTLHVTLAHPHIYEPHFSMVKACVVGLDSNEWREAKAMGLDGNPSDMLTSWCTGVESALPAWPVQDIVEDPDGYVEHVKRLAARVPSSPWSPKPMVVV
jgi:thymidylate synthase